MSNLKTLFDKNNRRSWFNGIKQSIIIEKYYNNLPENFEAIVLSGQPENSNSPNAGETIGSGFSEANDNRYYFVRIRPLMSIDNILPDPFSEKHIPTARKLINMHPIAYIAVNDTVHPPTHGDVFQCRYTRDDKLGFQLVDRIRDSGKKIGLFDNRSTHQQFNTLTPGLYRDSDGYGDDFGGTDTFVSEGKVKSGGLNFTFEEYKELSQLGVFDPILTFVRKRETGAASEVGGNQYDAYNYFDYPRINGKPKKKLYTGKTGLLEKPLTQYTIAEIRYIQENGVIKGQGTGRMRDANACGGYQLIGNTFGSAIDNITGLDTGFIFSKENQDALGVYLVTRKRVTLGHYLFGRNNSMKSAGNDLAYEFASIHLQRAAVRTDRVYEDNPDPPPKRIRLPDRKVPRPAYTRYYDGDGIHREAPPNKPKADEARDAMNATRNLIAGNARAKELYEIANNRKKR